MVSMVTNLHLFKYVLSELSPYKWLSFFSLIELKYIYNKSEFSYNLRSCYLVCDIIHCPWKLNSAQRCWLAFRILDFKYRLTVENVHAPISGRVHFVGSHLHDASRLHCLY